MRNIKSTEKETQKACIEYLTAKKIFFWRQNSGAFKTERGGFYSMGVKGAPDIFAVIKGTLYAFEIKDIKGKQNENQIEFEKNLMHAGGKYFVIRNIDEFIKLV